MNLSYRTYRIPKGKSGKFRKISEPNEELKAWQLGALKKLYKVKPHLVNHGFVPSKSIATNAKPHVGKTNVLSLDIEKFFPNTNKTKVSKILKEKFPEYENVIERFLLNGSLPQGAPTSPYIANFALDRFDEIIY